MFVLAKKFCFLMKKEYVICLSFWVLVQLSGTPLYQMSAHILSSTELCPSLIYMLIVVFTTCHQITEANKCL